MKSPPTSVEVSLSLRRREAAKADGVRPILARFSGVGPYEAGTELDWGRGNNRERYVQNKRAPRYCDAPLPPLIWLPQHSRRPAVIRSAAAPCRGKRRTAAFLRKTRRFAPRGCGAADRFATRITEPAMRRPARRASDGGCRAPRVAVRRWARRCRLPDRSRRCRSRLPGCTLPCTCIRPVRLG